MSRVASLAIEFVVGRDTHGLKAIEHIELCDAQSRQAIQAGRYYKVFVFDLLGVVVNLVLNLVLIPRFQLPGALAANACGQWCIWLAYTLYHRKEGNWRKKV